MKEGICRRILRINVRLHNFRCCQSTAFSNFAKSIIQYSWPFVYLRIQFQKNTFFCSELYTNIFFQVQRGRPCTACDTRRALCHITLTNTALKYTFCDLQAIIFSLIHSLLEFWWKSGLWQLRKKMVYFRYILSLVNRFQMYSLTSHNTNTVTCQKKCRFLIMLGKPKTDSGCSSIYFVTTAHFRNFCNIS